MQSCGMSSSLFVGGLLGYSWDICLFPACRLFRCVTPPPLFNKETNWQGYVLGPNCISKALLHLTIQCKCIGDESDKAVFKSISRQHCIMGSKHYEGDSDLGSTLGIVNCTFSSVKPMHQQNSLFTVLHYTWMGYTLLCHT